MLRFAVLILCAMAFGCRKSPEDQPRVVVSPGPTVWSPQAEVLPTLTKSAEIGGYRLQIPADLQPVKSPPTDSRVQVGFWKKEVKPGEPLALLSVTIVTDLHAAAEAKLIFPQYLAGFSTEATRAMDIGISNRSDLEKGNIGNLEFSRFRWEGMLREKTSVRGILYGTLQGDQIISINGMNFGPTAEKDRRTMESIIATFAKQ